MKEDNKNSLPVESEQEDIIIYTTDDGLSSVVLIGAEGMVWLSQMQIAKLFATSKQTVSCHISNILKDKELPKSAVVKEFLTTASDGKSYPVEHYSLDMVLDFLFYGMSYNRGF